MTVVLATYITALLTGLNVAIAAMNIFVIRKRQDALRAWERNLSQREKILRSSVT